MPTKEQADQIYSRLRATAERPPRDLSEATEIYFDLRISGDDLYELLAWIAGEFKVDFSGMKLGEFAPHEGAELWPPITKPYKSLTIGALFRAVDARKWQE